MDKRELTLAEVDGELGFELPRRDTLAVAIAGPGLVNVAAAIDRVNVEIPVNVEENNICVQNVSVLSAGAAEASCET